MFRKPFNKKKNQREYKGSKCPSGNIYKLDFSCFFQLWRFTKINTKPYLFIYFFLLYHNNKLMVFRI